MTELNDQSLLTHWYRHRNAEAFRVLASRHARMVYATALRILRNAHDAEEVAQQSFLALAQTRRPPSGNVAAWLHRTAYHAALNLTRARNRRTARDHAYAAAQPDSIRTDWDDIRDLVDEAVAGLPDACRECIVLYFFEEQTHAAIGEHLGITRQAVAQRIEKGSALVRKRLASKGVVAPAGAALVALIHENSAHALPATLTTELGRIALAGTPSMWAVGATYVSGFGIKAAAALLVAGAATVALQVSLERGVPFEPTPLQTTNVVATESSRTEELAAGHSPGDAVVPPLAALGDQLSPRESSETSATITADSKMYQVDGDVTPSDVAASKFEAVMEAQINHFNEIETSDIESVYHQKSRLRNPDGVTTDVDLTLQRRFRTKGQKWRHDINVVDNLSGESKQYQYSFDGEVYQNMIISDKHLIIGTLPSHALGETKPSPPPHLIPYQFAIDRPSADLCYLFSKRLTWEDLWKRGREAGNESVNGLDCVVIEFTRQNKGEERRFRVYFAAIYDYLPIHTLEYWRSENEDWILKNEFQHDEVFSVESKAGRQVFFSKRTKLVSHASAEFVVDAHFAYEVTNVELKADFPSEVYTFPRTELRVLTDRSAGRSQLLDSILNNELVEDLEHPKMPPPKSGAEKDSSVPLTLPTGPSETRSGVVAGVTIATLSAPDDTNSQTQVLENAVVGETLQPRAESTQRDWYEQQLKGFDQMKATLAQESAKFRAGRAVYEIFALLLERKVAPVAVEGELGRLRLIERAEQFKSYQDVPELVLDKKLKEKYINNTIYLWYNTIARDAKAILESGSITVADSETYKFESLLRKLDSISPSPPGEIPYVKGSLEYDSYMNDLRSASLIAAQVLTTVLTALPEGLASTRKDIDATCETLTHVSNELSAQPPDKYVDPYGQRIQDYWHKADQAIQAQIVEKKTLK